MKLLLIGPQPPPHGGISVHVAEVHRRWTDRSVPCRILSTTPSCLRLGFAFALLSHAARGWTLHVHTNGHNRKSWLLALACGLAGRLSGAAVLTLHSGMVPEYLDASARNRRIAKNTCSLYGRIVCVSRPIEHALSSLGVPRTKLEVSPAYLGVHPPNEPISPILRLWMAKHDPVFSTTLFFRPEYGFDLLISTLAELRRRYPTLGCVVMGSDEQSTVVRRQIRDAGLEEHIFITGDLEHKDCLAVMNHSTAFLRPTLQDGDSMSVREALSLGLPVVASDAGTRPPGVLLFRTGDKEEFLTQIEAALAWKVTA